MRSVRESLKGKPPDPESPAPGQELMDGPPDLEIFPGPSPEELIAERLRFAADQRAAFAQNEIKQLQIHIDQLQERIQELAALSPQRGDLKDDLDVAQHRLEEARADLVRATEARQNTDLTASLSQGHQEQLQAENPRQGHQSGTEVAPNVRSVIGKTSRPPKVDRGPLRKL